MELKDIELLKETSDLDIIDYLINKQKIYLLDKWVTPSFSYSFFYINDNTLYSRTKLVNSIKFTSIEEFINFITHNINHIIYIYSIRWCSDNKILVRLYINLDSNIKDSYKNTKIQFQRNIKLNTILND
jgi:hypothetical protein